MTARFKPLRFIEWMLPRLQTLRVNTSTELLAFLLEEQACSSSRKASSSVDVFTLSVCKRGSIHSINRNGLKRAVTTSLGLQYRAVVQAFRQFTEEFSVVLNDLSGLIERISLLQEEIGARQLEQSNRTLYTLTVITVLALPINIVAGFFGMNVGGIPLASNHHGFILLVVIVAVFTLGAGYLAFRRRDDL